VNSPINSRSGLLFCGLLILFFGANISAAVSRSENAVRLVHAMQIDQLTLLGLQGPFRKATRLRAELGENRDEGSRKTYTCIMGIEKSIFTDLFSDVVNREMSEDEITMAVAFYEGTVGAKIIERDRWWIAHDVHWPTSRWSEVQLSIEENNALERFAKTPAGRKILRKPGVFNDAQLTQMTVSRWQDALRTKCGIE
jgi:hypothetical protein